MNGFVSSGLNPSDFIDPFKLVDGHRVRDIGPRDFELSLSVLRIDVTSGRVRLRDLRRSSRIIFHSQANRVARDIDRDTFSVRQYELERRVGVFDEPETYFRRNDRDTISGRFLAIVRH